MNLRPSINQNILGEENQVIPNLNHINNPHPNAPAIMARQIVPIVPPVPQIQVLPDNFPPAADAVKHRASMLALDMLSIIWRRNYKLDDSENNPS